MPKGYWIGRVDVSNPEGRKRFAHSLTKFPASCPRQTDFSREQIVAADLRHYTRLVDCFTHACGSVGDSHAHWIGWSSATFADDALVRIENDGVGLCATTVNSNYRVLCTQSSGGKEIGCAAVGAHCLVSI